jgi:mRNA interferase HigB
VVFEGWKWFAGTLEAAENLLTLCRLQSSLRGLLKADVVNIVTRRHLAEAETRYPDAAKEVRAWGMIAKHSRWRSFVEVRQVFGDADAVNGYVVFNLRRNRYGLITVIHYSRERHGRLTEGHIYIRSFLTHAEYDNKANWDKGVQR